MKYYPKQWQNSDLRETKQIIYHSKSIDKSYPKNVLFIEFEPLSQKLWTFLSNFVFFTMPAHQMWSCHVTQDAEVEIFYFVLILYLILRKVKEFLVERLLTLDVISQKPHGGGGGNNHPVYNQMFLYNVCSVHREMFSTSGGCSVHRGIS